MIVKTKNEQETTKLGYVLGSLMKNNTAVYLYGEMASGKTQLSRGIADYFNMLNDFSSPTYTIINEYKNNGDVLYHMDAYRLESIEELEYVGFFDIYKENKIIIEWPEVIEDILEKTGVEIKIKIDEDDFNSREIEINAYEDSKEIVRKLEDIYE